MGWDVDGWGITVCLDAHAGDQERADVALWEELRARLREVAKDPRYRTILVTDVDED